MIACEEVTRRLDDVIDEALAPADREAVAGHIESCDACRAELSARRALLAAAAGLPREVAPPHDLWPGIAARLEAAPRRSARTSLRPWVLLPAAAVVLLTVGVLVGTRLGHGPRGNADASPGGLQPIAAAWPSDTLERAEAEYERAARELARALESERAKLPPETAAAVERNVAIIDQALAEVREAHRRDPGNPVWADLLVATYRQKVDVLSRARHLSASL